MLIWSGKKAAGMAVAGALALAACAVAEASWFSKGQPVPDWGVQAAKTPTPAYANDASAVILYDEYVESVDANGRATEREREAIRILKPQGRKNTCEVSYDVDEKVNYFRVWTIAADEKTYEAQPTDFVEEGDTNIPVMLSTNKSRVAHPPAVDVGATIICESEEVLAPYQQEKSWHFQTGIPIVFQALEVDLPPGRTHAESWHAHESVKPVEVSPNHWRWELKDMPAFTLRDIPSHPEYAALVARMHVQWGDAAVEGIDNQWRALGNRYSELEAHRPDPSPEITAKTNELLTGAPDFYSKLSRITEFIQKNVRYFIVSRGISGWQANHAADIYRNHYGDCKDKTTLLISMLKAAGINASYVLVDDRRGVIDPNTPSFYGDHMITAIEIPPDVKDDRLRAVATGKDGKRWLIFDPTNERTPVGNLPSYEQGSYGLLCVGPASQVLGLPVLSPDANGTEVKGEFTLAADGTLAGSVDTSHIGPEGGELRRFLKETDEKERRQAWETYVAHDVPGLSLTSFQFVQPSALDKPLEFHYKFTVAQYAHSAGPLLLVRPRVVDSLAKPFDDKPRKVAIDLSETGTWKDSYNITLPDGYVVDETPDPVNIQTDFASYKSNITAKGNTLHYEREYVIKKVEIPADEATEFRKLQSAILMDEKGTAVLKKAIK